jgi:hypothetical protein
MKTNPYEITCRPDSAMLGRERELQTLFERLAGNHVSVIAPRLFGKTMLLREVGRRAKEHGFAQYIAWDLRHHTPASDEAFYETFCGEMGRQLCMPGQDLEKWFREFGASFEVIKAVFQELQKTDRRVLILLDGIDGVLQAGTFTQNVWDNLRDLADLSCVRFLTASRSPLRQLCPPDSKTSPFWNIFHPTPLRFGAFQTWDWPEVLRPLLDKGVTLEESGRKELLNWTGSIPVLAIAVCGRLFAGFDKGQVVAKAEVDTAAQRVAQDFRDHITTLWNDLPTEARLDVLEMASQKEIGRAGRAGERLEFLIARGLAVEAGGNKFKPGCRLMEQFAIQHGQSLPEVKKLFGAGDDYEQNLPEVLQLRLAQARGLNPELEEHIENLVKALPRPEIAKELLRGVADRCLALLVQHEFPGGTIDAALVNDWKFNNKLNNSENDREILKGKVPGNRGPRMKLLSLLHDEDIKGKAKTRRSSFVLLQAVYSAGSYGQHAAEIGEATPKGFVTAIACVAVELLHQIREDLTARHEP